MAIRCRKLIFVSDKEIKKGTGSSLLLLYKVMIQPTTIETIRQMLEPLLTEDLFLVDIRIKPTNNVKVYLDADGGLPIEACTRINRALYKQIDEKVLFENGDFSLEVSSPGLDEPLKLHRQYQKNIGRDLNLLLVDERSLSGTLKAVTEEAIDIEYTEGKNKKAVLKQETIPFSQIKKALIAIKF